MSNTKMELVVVSPEPLDLGDVDLQTMGIEVATCRSPWGNRNTSRNLGYQKASGSWVYFVDQDVRFPEENLSLFAQTLRDSLQFSKEVWLMSGPYQSSLTTTFWGRVYNELTNLWLENPRQPYRCLAGNLLMRKQRAWSAPFSENLLNGGEEIEMAEQVRARGGHLLFRPELAVLHLAEHDLSLFWKRLCTHLSFKSQATGDLQKTRFDFRMLWRILKRPLVWPGVVVYMSALFCARVRHSGHFLSTIAPDFDR